MIDVLEAIGQISISVVTVLWCLIALLAFFDAGRMLSIAGFVYLQSAGLPQDQRTLARGRLGIARWFFLGFLCNLLVGVIALSLLVLDLPPPFAPPPPDTSVTTTVLRLLLVIGIFAFWRAKRGNVKIGKQLEDGDAEDEAPAKETRFFWRSR